MQLKPFEAGRYDNEFVVIQNPANGKQELFTEEEFEIVKFLKQNENETLLALLLPNIGIAKKDHIVICLRVLSKLKRMQIVDYFSITGRKVLSNTSTLEIEMEKRKIEIAGLNALAAFVFGVKERSLAWIGPYGVLALSLALAAFGFLFFPFERISIGIEGGGIQYSRMLLVMYLTVCLAFSARSLLQAVFLRAIGRRSQDHGFSVIFPFVSLYSEKREVNLAGFNSRIQIGLVGLLAPLALSAVFSALFLLDVVGIQLAFYGFSACVFTTLILSCPFLPYDGADILHSLFIRNELKERISSGLRGIFRAKGSLSREMLVGLVATFIWLLVWLDSLRSFWDSIAEVATFDLYASSVLVLKIGAGITVLALLCLVAMPVVVFAYGFFRDKFGPRRRRVVVRGGDLKESLTFEERMAALERIPLFAYLQDSDRLSLLNEMHPAYYPDGEYMVHQGEVGKEFFVLVKGNASAFFTDIQGKSYLLADIGEGDAFGEIALIDDVPRTASIVSDGGCVVLVLSKEGFDRFAASFGSPDRVKVMIRLTSFFRRHPLFSKLGVKDQAQLIDALQFDTLTTGDEIPSDQNKFFVIYSGKVRMDTGDDSTDMTLQADDCFGYTDGINVSYFALEGTGLLSIKQEEFYSLIWEKLVERPELFV